jgi:AAA+ ATPase superfamily predicted ATPase
MFIGRERELQTLNGRYNSGKFEFLPIYGRRRVGKTALIQKFIEGRKAIFFTAVESSESQNLRGLSSAIYEFANSVAADLSFDSFGAAFDSVFEIAKKEKVIFVIDEYPYLAESYAPVSSILQKYIDHKFKNTDMFIILCGSSMSFMEYQVLGYKSPLYGRRTGQIKVEPFSFADSAKFHKNFKKEEQAVIYGITGGIPRYLEMIDDRLSLKENIINAFFTADTMLFEEPSNLLKQELREPQTYNGILTSIAEGASKMNEIVTKANIAGFDSSKCNKYLQSLIALGIIKKELPILALNSKKSIYRLNDGMFRFWYRFVSQNISRIHLGLGDAVYSRIEPQLPAYMGEVFEEICKQWLWQENIGGRLFFQFQDCGRWWETDPVLKEEVEIDLLAFDDDKRKAIFGECKWTNEKIGKKTVDALEKKADKFNYDEKYYILFSKSGFTEDLKKNATNCIKVVEFKDML